MPDYSKPLARAIAAMTGTAERTTPIVSMTNTRRRPLSEILDIRSDFVEGPYHPRDGIEESDD